MKILHTEASRGWGGQEIRILTEAAGMIARGHTVELACPPDARIFAEAPRFGVPVHALPIARKKPVGLLAAGWSRSRASAGPRRRWCARGTSRHPSPTIAPAGGSTAARRRTWSRPESRCANS